MNQLGPIFKEARIKSGKTLDDAVKETKITKRYLTAIENEDFDIFPGETYLIGFIRNYSQFLDLDQEEMIKKYKDYKIQEQPSPIEELTARPKNKKRNIVILITTIIFLASVIYVFLINKKEGNKSLNEKKEKIEQKKTEKVISKTNITVFEDEEIIKDFRSGDIIEIPVNGKNYNIEIDRINENLNFSLDSVPFSLATDERVEIDFNGDGKKDLLLRINKLGENIANLALKKIYRTKPLGSEGSIQQGEERKIDKFFETGKPDIIIIKEDGLLSKIPVAPENGFKIISSYEKTDINASVTANNKAYLGYIIDDEKKKDVLFKNGDTISLIAKDILKITAANAGGINFKINNISLELGKSGEVVAKTVRWYSDSEDKDLYHLVLSDWEK